MSLLRRPVSPAIPLATPAYDVSAATRHNGVLRLFFNQLDAFFTALIGERGGQYLNNPYGAFSSRVNQTAGAINTPYVVALATTDYANGTSVSSNKVSVEQSGVYNLQFSLQFENSDSQNHEVWIWFRKNGTDVEYTGSNYAAPSSHGGVNGYLIAVANFFINLNADDYIELVWATNSTQVILEAYTASASPFTRPGIPSAVLTASFVSALSE